MVIVIKKGSSKRVLSTLLKKAIDSSKQRKLNAHRYCGVVKFKEDGLILQKQWRDEWR
jgi:hypothetical protein